MNHPKALPAIILLVIAAFSIISVVPKVQGTVTVKASMGSMDVAYDSAKGYVYVANDGYLSDGSSVVSVISDSTNAVVATVTVGDSPFGVLYDPGNSEVYVSNDGAKTVSVISDATNQVVAMVNLNEDNPFGMVYDPSKNEVFVADYSSFASCVSVIDDVTNTVTATIPVGNTPSWLAYDSSLNEIFVSNTRSNTVSVISDITNSVVATIPVGRSPFGIAYDPANHEVYVANQQDNTTSVISDSTNSVVATVAVGDMPQGVAYDPDNGEIFVSNYLDNTLSVIAGSSNTVVATVPVGSYPVGEAYDSGRKELFVADWGSGSVSVIDVSGNVPLPTVTPSPSVTPTPVPTPVPTPNPALGTWVSKAPIPEEVASSYDGCAVVNGIIYVIGDTFSYAYNPANNSWTKMQAMPTARNDFAIAASGGKIYVIGGFLDAGGSTCGINEVYDPATNTWSTASPMPLSRGEMNAEAVDGKIYVMGGRTDAAYSTVNVTEVYDPTTDSWSTLAPMPYPVVAYASAVVDGKIYVIAGQDEWYGFTGMVGFGSPAPNPTNPNIQFTQIFNPSTDSWSLGASTPALSTGIDAEATTGVFAPVRIYVFGGLAGFAVGSNETFVYDPAANSWSPANAMPDAVSCPLVAVVNDQFYVIGGGNAMNTFSYMWQFTPIGYSAPSPTPTSPAAPTNSVPRSASSAVTVNQNTATVDMSSVTGVGVTVKGNSLADGSQINATSTYYGAKQPSGTGKLAFDKVFFYDVKVSPSSGTFGSDVQATVSISNPSFTGSSVMEYWNGTAWVTVATAFTAPDSVSATVPASDLTGTPIAVCGQEASGKSSVTNIVYGAAAGLAIAVIAIAVIAQITKRERQRTEKPSYDSSSG